MSARVIVHLGLHKTATGTLQRQLFPATREIKLFTTLDDPMREFMQLVTRKDPAYFDADYARSLLQLDDARTNLVSNESLSGPPYAGVIEGGLDHRTPVLTNLARVYPQAQAVVVIRRQDKLAQSFYRQYLKSGGTRDVNRFFGFTAGQTPLFAVDRFDFAPWLRAVREAFPQGLLVLPFEQFVRDQSAFLDRLAQFMGVSFPDMTLTTENSTKLGPTGMVASRLLNHLFRNLLNPAGLIPGIPVKRFGKYRSTSPGQLLHDYAPKSSRGVDRGPIHAAGERILNAERERNRSLADEFGLGLEEHGYF
ncbi:MAG: sulfotransferase [Pseudomonadota bacterium]